jgi:hypothetical protein
MNNKKTLQISPPPSPLLYLRICSFLCSYDFARIVAGREGTLEEKNDGSGVARIHYIGAPARVC